MLKDLSDHFFGPKPEEIDEKLRPLFYPMFNLDKLLPLSIKYDYVAGACLETGVLPIRIPFKDGSQIVLGKAEYLDGHNNLTQAPYIELNRPDPDGIMQASGPVTFYPLAVTPGPVFLYEGQPKIDNSRRGSKNFANTEKRYIRVLKDLSKLAPENIDVGNIPLTDFAASLIAKSLGATINEAELRQRYTDEGNEAGLLLIDLTNDDLLEAFGRINRLNHTQGVQVSNLEVNALDQVATYNAIARKPSYPNMIDISKIDVEVYPETEETPRIEISPEHIQSIYEALLVTGLVKKHEDGRYSFNPFLGEAVAAWTRG